MNIINSEEPYEVVAKTCGCKEKTRKACERLKNYTIDEIDRSVIETEIAELKMTLDLLP